MQYFSSLKRSTSPPNLRILPPSEFLVHLFDGLNRACDSSTLMAQLQLCNNNNNLLPSSCMQYQELVSGDGSETITYLESPYNWVYSLHKFCVAQMTDRLREFPLQSGSYFYKNLESKATVTTTIRLDYDSKFECRSTLIRLEFDRATIIRRSTLEVYGAIEIRLSWAGLVCPPPLPMRLAGQRSRSAQPCNCLQTGPW